MAANEAHGIDPVTEANEESFPASDPPARTVVTGIMDGPLLASTATHYRWSDIAPEQVNPSTNRRYVMADRVTIARFELAAGGVVPRHSHENEQVTCVLSGALKFAFDGQEIVARAGDVVQIPSWLPHEVHVLEEALVIDVFSPIRQDWIDKTDNYFRAPTRIR
jgi:quercetin dioxygenase-like cupin family protein